jgi:hypothetical protein
LAHGGCGAFRDDEGRDEEPEGEEPAIDRLLDPVGHTGLSGNLARAAAQQARVAAHDIAAAW